METIAITHSTIEIVFKGSNMNGDAALGVRRQFPLVGSFISEEGGYSETKSQRMSWIALLPIGLGRYNKLTGQPE